MKKLSTCKLSGLPDLLQNVRELPGDNGDVDLAHQINRAGSLFQTAQESMGTNSTLLSSDVSRKLMESTCLRVLPLFKRIYLCGRCFWLVFVGLWSSGGCFG